MQIFIEALATSELTNVDAYKCRYKMFSTFDTCHVAIQLVMKLLIIDHFPLFFVLFEQVINAND